MKAVWSVLLIAVIPFTLAFQERGIFENEDIYNMALRPLAYAPTIVPGTKWCGPGNVSTGYDDLGFFKETDKCCRDHDYCPDIIAPGASLHNLTNPDIFVRLSCDCEQEFVNCLQAANELVSNMMGRAYFGAQTKCFKLDFPAVQCLEYQTMAPFGKRCIKYKFDDLKPKKWQWFDMPFYPGK